jgi:GMP synthase (glutamine-hydrolysing)
MKIHYFQHVPFEDLANIEPAVLQYDFNISKTAFFKDDTLPPVDDIDWLIILGGPMSVYEDKKYPWLVAEKIFIEEAIEKGKKVTGICLGAQLIADVLGAKVYKNTDKEIGWLPVTLTEGGLESNIFDGLPETFMVFHWHGDTFDLPENAVNLAYSEATKIQAFEYPGNVSGIQFHLEYTRESIEKMLDNCSNEIVPGKYIQTQNTIRNGYQHLLPLKRYFHILFNNLSNPEL